MMTTRQKSKTSFTNAVTDTAGRGELQKKRSFKADAKSDMRLTRQGTFGKDQDQDDIAEIMGSKSNKSTPVHGMEKDTPIMGGKSKRGRKPIKDDKYITESMIQIEKYEQEMKDK